MPKEFADTLLVLPGARVGRLFLLFCLVFPVACGAEAGRDASGKETSISRSESQPVIGPAKGSEETEPQPPLQIGADSWTSSRGDLLNTGQASSKQEPRGPRRRWEWRAVDRLSHTPVAIDGVLYIGDWTPSFYAISLDTGEELWRSRPKTIKNDNRELPEEGENLLDVAVAREVDDRYEFSAPVIHDDLVIAATQNGIVTAYERKSGAIRWEVDVEADVYSSLRVFEGKLLFGNDQGYFQERDVATGELLFQYQVGDTIGSTCAVLSDGTAIFPAHDRRLHFVDTKTGQARQAVDIGYRSSGTPLVAFGCVYFFHSGMRLIAYDMLDGQVRWEQAGNNVTSHALARCDGMILAHVGNELRAFDGVRGDILWRRPLSAAGAHAPVVGPKTIFATDGNAVLHAVDRKTGEEIWSDRFDEAAATGPILVDGLLICVGGTGKLIAYE